MHAPPQSEPVGQSALVQQRMGSGTGSQLPATHIMGLSVFCGQSLSLAQQPGHTSEHVPI
jgi:hypothetical protein